MEETWLSFFLKYNNYGRKKFYHSRPRAPEAAAFPLTFLSVCRIRGGMTLDRPPSGCLAFNSRLVTARAYEFWARRPLAPSGPLPPDTLFLTFGGEKYSWTSVLPSAREARVLTRPRAQILSNRVKKNGGRWLSFLITLVEWPLPDEAPVEVHVLLRHLAPREVPDRVLPRGGPPLPPVLVGRLQPPLD